MNDDYIDQQTFFVFKSSSYLYSFMVGPRTFWTPLVSQTVTPIPLSKGRDYEWFEQNETQAQAN